MTEEQLLSEMNTGILRWYPFKRGASVLMPDTGRADDPFSKCRESLRAWLVSEGCRVDIWPGIFPEDEKSRNEAPITRSARGYDYIILAGILEYRKRPAEEMRRMLTFLEPQGRILLITDNR